MALHIPSPPVNGFHIGAAFIHFYGLMYVIGIALAVIITRRRWEARGGNPALVADVATWAVPAGIIGARIYFDLTTPADIPHHWWGVFAVWSGGLGVWGGIAAGALAGAWRVRRAGASVPLFMDAIAPALLVAQAVGRLGNYFNQELFGKPTSLPWGLQIDPQFRPPGYEGFTTFQPTFLYEMLFDLALAGLLVWLGRRGTIRPPGLFALYVTGYSAFRIFEESLRIDSSAALPRPAAELLHRHIAHGGRRHLVRPEPAPAAGSGPAGRPGGTRARQPGTRQPGTGQFRPRQFR